VVERAAKDRTRRRFARRQWARRWLAWRRLLVGVLVIAAVGFAIYAIYLSPWLRVEGADVTGTSQLTEAEVLLAAKVPTGDALARVDLTEIEAQIEGRLTAVEAVDATRQWPHEIRIEIEEREPIAVVTEGSGYVFLAAGGYAFTYVEVNEDGVLKPEVPKDPPGHLPRVVVGSQADRFALEEAAAVVTALDPDVTRLVDHIEVESADRILLRLREGRVVTWGSSEESDQKAAVLLSLLEAEPDATSYDVSVPGLPATS